MPLNNLVGATNSYANQTTLFDRFGQNVQALPCVKRAATGHIDCKNTVLRGLIIKPVSPAVNSKCRSTPKPQQQVAKEYTGILDIVKYLGLQSREQQ